MSQFFSMNQSQDRTKQNNNSESQRTSERPPLVQSNIVFSPHSEQNFLVDNYVCQSFPSPLGSFYQAFSPMQYAPQFQEGSIGTPIYVDSFKQNLNSIVQNIETNNNTPVAYMLPLLPLRVDSVKPELIMPAVNLAANKQSFNQFSKTNTTSLKAFLQGQLGQNTGFESIQVPDKIIEPIRLSEEILFQEKETLEEPKTVLKRINFSESSIMTYEPSQNSGNKFSQLSLKSTRFEVFNDILFKVFSDGKLCETAYENLSKFEKKLLFFLIKRKYLPKAFKDPAESTEEPSYLKLINILGSFCNKRPEECYKFILTRVIKYLKHKFENNNKTKSKVEDSLYEEYFQTISDTYKIPLSDFHYPLTGSLKGKFKLNSVYFSKIFMSQKFVDALSEYSNKLLLSEYSTDIKKKLETLMDRWAELLDSESGIESEKQKEILDYVMFNKRCKLPWSVSEVRESVEKFDKLVGYYLPSGKGGKKREEKLKRH